MLQVYRAADLPPYLDATAADLLGEARAAFAELELAERRVVAAGNDSHLFLWKGSAVNSVVAVVLTCAGYECEAHDVGVTVFDVRPEELQTFLGSIVAIPTAEEVSNFAENLRTAKYDEYLPEHLLRREWAKRSEPIWPEVATAVGEAASAMPAS